MYSTSNSHVICTHGHFYLVVGLLSPSGGGVGVVAGRVVFRLVE